ncbi:nitrate- and nitrite sensing domain-containing protein [Streptosporangium sp. NBC_01755]|uniref:sensor histidine kinase n=1 Tax=unclassified Streptosporangium TaxID=2632669 RepID=UPI002DD934DA|nr:MULTISPECIES: nitrate- and nitrite sensing domain-containing protein [unclassified Streptosporangium]WSA25013.1 nitrate- and nitrite sensing domain-containing protein [Streptosporangium sp. NBC_01810]WSD03656.1 nitrate- and nitrite sensing domain-containing protein [Streptosporangium sp. NBC_01755]
MLLLLPLLSLSALWGFVLNLTIGDGIALLNANSIYQSVGMTSTELGLQLQAERMQSSVAISSRVLTSGMGEQRSRTDRAVQAFKKATASDDSGSPELRSSLDRLLSRLDTLSNVRSGIDSGQQSRLEVLSNYNHVLDAVFLVYDQMAAVPDLAIFQQATAMQGMGNAYEMLARENALVSGALIDYRLSEGERKAFGEYVTTRKFLHTKGAASLDPELGTAYRDTFKSAAFVRFTNLEKAIAGSTGNRLAPEAGRWKASVNEISTWLDKVNLAASKELADRAQTMATGVLLRIVIAGGVGLIAVVASIIFSVRFGRRLAAELAGLRSAALDLADVRLPRVVDRLRRGEEVDVQAEAPPIQACGSAEVRDVAHAFGSVQRTAVEAAVGQANLRRGVSQVFVNLARRKQSLLHRQLTLLDSMQHRATDPDSLEDLFQLDHLTTRMRRHAEGLIILSGAAPGRSWRKPVPVIDVLRAAIAEVEDYTRVNVMPVADVSLDGSTVADITHLVAELVENATIYSPPQAMVTVRGDVVANGFAVEVEDRGLGLGPMEYAAINERLAGPPEFDLADSDRLGLFVVGQLASRHGIQVMLRNSPFGGTTAIVFIPRTVIAQQGSPLALTVEQASSSTEHAAKRPGELFAPSSPDTFSPPVNGNGLPRRTRPASPAQSTAAPSLSVVTNLPARAPSAGQERHPGGSVGQETGRARASFPAPHQESPRGSRESHQTPHEIERGNDAPARRTASQPATGPGGLPRRIRQANLAPQLRQEAEATESAEPEPRAEPREERSPDEVRALFSAFQAGARRGREEQDDALAHHTTGDKGDT